MSLEINAPKKTNESIYPEYNEIIPGLILGSLDGLYQSNLEKDFPNIDVIISVAPSDETPLPNKYMKNKLIFKSRFPISGKLSIETIANMLITIADTIHNILDKQTISTNCIYIHCYEGISRSAASVIYYLIKYRNMSYEEAMKFVISRRSNINLNQIMVNVLDYLLE